MYLWTQDVPSDKMYYDPLIFPPSSPCSRSIRWLPRIQIGGSQCSSLDLNESWLSFFVQGTDDIVVIEWTFVLDDPQERRCKGIMLSCPELQVCQIYPPLDDELYTHTHGARRTWGRQHGRECHREKTVVTSCGRILRAQSCCSPSPLWSSRRRLSYQQYRLNLSLVLTWAHLRLTLSRHCARWFLEVHVLHLAMRMQNSVD